MSNPRGLLSHFAQPSTALGEVRGVKMNDRGQFTCERGCCGEAMMQRGTKSVEQGQEPPERQPRTGVGNFSKWEIMHLLRITEKHSPIRSQGWKNVAHDHEVEFPGQGRTALMRKHPILEEVSAVSVAGSLNKTTTPQGLANLKIDQNHLFV